MTQTSSTLQASWLGRVPYQEAYDLQCALLEKRYEGRIPDHLLLLEHPHVYTLGRRGASNDVLIDAQQLRLLGAEVTDTDRGGQATYHGPGQLVGYPILDLRSAGLGAVGYVRLLEKILIDALAEYGIEGTTVEGRTGVWVADPGVTRDEASVRKIAAIGVRVSRGVSMHGFALNVATELSYFQHIVPCGMPDLSVASIASLTGQAPSLDAVANQIAEVFARRLDRGLIRVSRSQLAA